METKNNKKFGDSDLAFDLEKIKAYDKPKIKKGTFKNELKETVYTIEVNDVSYFYYEKVGRNEDCALLKELLKSDNVVAKKKLIRKRVMDLLNVSMKAAIKNIDKAIKSGSVDIASWDENDAPQILPKCLLIAVLREEIDKHDARGTSFEKRIKKESNNIKLFL
jgi:hypothetical protein